MENVVFKKNIIKFNEPVDFNFVSKILNRNNFNSTLSSNWLNVYILNTTFKILRIEKDKAFIDLFHYLNDNYNDEKLESNLYMFFSLKMGSTSTTHVDNYDVVIIGAHGETIYNIEGKEYRVCVGDLLKIPKNVTHTAISMTPRIVLSYGKYN